ncbi:PREDICTED: uncharacterized protein LOC107168866 [Diuraphis noxia]|uniref:uncharacterized protein LOC107168866 n=1 Tax=Diuraphis noxia TaxID=143948 RepID=UPI000763B092|nr:PREDICTED: uncharacterized protein LOC107168866 [Diuraphis noxia]
MNTFLVFSSLIVILGGACFQSINANGQFCIETKNFTGQWYAVMATGCSDGKDCNIFTYNEVPCNCISAYFSPLLKDSSWLVYMNAINNQSLTLTVDMGGASVTADDKTIQGFILSRATMPLSVVSASECSITKKVVGHKFNLRFRMTIIGSNVEHRYMITTMSEIDKNNQDKGKPLTVIWCRVRTPGKNTIWRQIVLHFKNLGLDIHKLKFINQIGCRYPTQKQYNEMFFC